MLIAFLLLGVCVVIHTAGLVLLAEWLLEPGFPKTTQDSCSRDSTACVCVFAVIVFVHVAETLIWAIFYWFSGHFPTFETSWYFSFTSYTTIGFGDVVLPERWRILGGIEGLTGVLLCGISTAFMFVIVNALIDVRRREAAGNN
jgi:hypothetical protein